MLRPRLVPLWRAAAPATARWTTGRAAARAATPLRDALAVRDLEQVWRVWDGLRDDERASVPPREYAQVCRLAHERGAALPAHAAAPLWMERYGAWGTHAAQRRDAALVQRWMALALRGGRPDTAIAIMRAYVAARRQQHADQPWRMDVGAPRGAVHGALALLVLSFAAQHDLRGLVTLLQSFDVGSTTELFFDPAQCAKEWARAADALGAEATARAAQWVAHAELARGLHGGSGGGAGERRIARLLGSLLARRDAAGAWRLIDAALDAGVDPRRAASRPADAWLAATPLASSTQLGAWTESAWAVGLSGLLGAQRRDWAAQLWNAAAAVQEREPGWAPWSLWNAALDGFSLARQTDAVDATWQVMTRQAPVETQLLATPRPVVPPPGAPDVVCTTTMMSALFRARRAPEAWALYTALQQRIGHDAVPVETQNAVLHGLCSTNHLSEAETLFAAMGQHGTAAPTIVTINLMLRAQARQKHLGGMAQTLRTAQRLGLRPDVVTFTTVLDAALRTAATPAVAEAATRKVMHTMTEMGVAPSTITMTAMIKACLQSPTDAEARLVNAAHVMHIMCTTRKLSPSALTFETMIKGLVERPLASLDPHGPWPDTFTRALTPLPGDAEAPMPLSAVRMALALWDTMRARRITPTSDTSHVLIRALLAQPPASPAFCRGVCVADELLQAHGALAAAVDIPPRVLHASAYPPAPASWSAVLHALVRAHDAAPGDAALRRVLAAALHHFRTARVGAATMLAPDQTHHTGALLRWIEQAARLIPDADLGVPPPHRSTG